MKKLLKVVHIRQNGFTLIEILIALAISALMTPGTVMTIDQLFSQNQRDRERLQAIEQVENTAYWLNQDAMMAQTVTPGADSGFPLTLIWQGSNSNNNQVTYSPLGNSLQRSFSVNGSVATQTLIARNINFDETRTNSSYATNGVLTFQITSTIGKNSETRVYQIKLRADQPSP